MQTILLDFDGVLHDHSPLKWEGISVIKGQIVPGMKECIKELRKDYKIIIYSSRCMEPEGIKAIEKWLDQNDIIVDGITKDKLSYASIIVDDRAIQFNGSPDQLKKDIKRFKVWTKK